MSKKIISLDELSRFKSKYDTQVNNNFVKYNGSRLPLFIVETTDLVSSFLNSSVSNVALCLAVGTTGNRYIGVFQFSLISPTTVSFQFTKAGVSDAEYIGENVSLTNLTFSDIFSNTYKKQLEDSANKVTSLSGSSTDTQYPSAKCVYDNLQNVREVAEGKCKAFVLSYNETEPTEENFVANRWKKADGTPIATWEEFETYVGNRVFLNPDFNDNNDDVIQGGDIYIIDTTRRIFFNDGSGILSSNNDMSIGDVILITQTNVPDRWVDSNGVYRILETATLDPSGYVDDHTIAPAYSNLLTYAVGDLVIYDHKLYRCTTAVSSAENFDSTKWTQASVSDTFVDLYRDQTISGVKTFADGAIKTAEINSTYSNQIALRTNNTARAVVSNSEITTRVHIVPNLGYKSIDIGKDGQLFRDLYISRNLTDGTNSMSVADIVGSTFNVINASDIVNNTLTQAQYDLITNGKPTLIKGTLLGYTNIFLNGMFIRGVNPYFRFSAGVGTSNGSQGLMRVFSATKVINAPSDNYDSIANLGYINNKQIPAYPSSTGTFVLKFIDGTLTWVAE